MGDRSDGELLAGIRAADRDAWDELVHRYARKLWAVARARGLDALLAEDVVQSAWITLLDKHHTIINPEAVGGWLCRVARNEAIRVGKVHARTVPTEPPDMLAIEDTGLPAPDARVLLEATVDEVWAAISGLTEDYAELIVLRYVHGLSYREIGEITGRAGGGIGPSLMRAKIELARLLAS